MKWFNEILTAAKSFLGMDHDATEQEVHEKLTSMKNIDDMRATIQAEEGQRYGAQIQAEAERANSAEARAQELEAQLEAANTALDTLRDAVANLRTDAETLRERITELEKLPAASHTDGQPATSADGGEKLYHRNPLYQRAKQIQGTRTA